MYAFVNKGYYILESRLICGSLFQSLYRIRILFALRNFSLFGSRKGLTNSARFMEPLNDKLGSLYSR
jgi:hypothetical protein